MYDLAVLFSLDDLEDLVGNIRGDLVHGECHLFDIKDSSFGVSWGVN